MTNEALDKIEVALRHYAARIEVLEAALKPFADAADKFGSASNWGDHEAHWVSGDYGIDVGYLRTARAAFNGGSK